MNSRLPEPESAWTKLAIKRMVQEMWLKRARAAHELRTKTALIRFVFGTFGLSLLTALTIFLFEGFHFLGFHLDSGIIHWIGYTTVGSLATLAMMIYGAFFKKK